MPAKIAGASRRRAVLPLDAYLVATTAVLPTMFSNGL
jgi:hypothetical protein